MVYSLAVYAAAAALEVVHLFKYIFSRLGETGLYLIFFPLRHSQRTSNL